MAIAIVAVMTLMYAVPMSVFAETKAITIQGIKAGDTIHSYKVLKMNRTTGKYEWNITGMTADELTEIVGHYDSAAGKYVDGEISEATATKIANIVKGLGTTTTVAQGASQTVTGDVSGAAPYNGEEGLYCVLIAPVDTDTVYNPAFAAIQYTQDGPNTSDNSTIDFQTLTYSDTAKVKKSEIEVKKTAKAGDKGKDLGATDTDNATTANVGDLVTFTVTTKIPAFGANFTNAKYEISDSMSEGLAFQKFTSIEVDSVKTTDGTSPKATVDGNEVNMINTITTGNNWKMTFNPTYLLSNTDVVDVTITYTAKVTNAAIKNINPDTNTVSVEFSNNPKDTSSSKTIKDETRHYTFSIDMGLLGNSEWETSEFVKIGVDNDGKPIVASQTMDNGKVTNPLAGAKFKIFTDNKGEHEYTNDLISAGQQFTTDANGKLKIKGLGEGTYYLIEQSAPTGYIPDKTPVEVVISATYKTINMDPDGKAGTGDEYTYEALDTYTITVGGTTSTYTMENSGEQKDKIVSSSDQTKEWKNTKGVELPSTGGIGTTLFYLIGAILIIGAGVLLVTRRRTENAE